MKLTRRWAMLLTLLAGAGGLVLFGPPPKQAGEVVAAVPRSSPATGRASSSAQTQNIEAGNGMILAIRPRKVSESYDDAFALLNWTPPPPPPPPQITAPAKPTAPALPFTFLGKKLEEGSWQVFLARQDRTYIVRAQDTIERDYRVESIVPPTLVLTYLPLQERQSLTIGNAN